MASTAQAVAISLPTLRDRNGMPSPDARALPRSIEILKRCLAAQVKGPIGQSNYPIAIAASEILLTTNIDDKHVDALATTIATTTDSEVQLNLLP